MYSLSLDLARAIQPPPSSVSISPAKPVLVSLTYRTLKGMELAALPRPQPAPPAGRILISAQRILNMIAAASEAPCGGAGLQANLRENSRSDDRKVPREPDWPQLAVNG